MNSDPFLNTVTFKNQKLYENYHEIYFQEDFNKYNFDFDQIFISRYSDELSQKTDWDSLLSIYAKNHQTLALTLTEYPNDDFEPVNIQDFFNIEY